jgi:hypothetical protein
MSVYVKLMSNCNSALNKANANGRTWRIYVVTPVARDTLEISGIPVIAGENTNAIVLKVDRLAAPDS